MSSSESPVVLTVGALSPEHQQALLADHPGLQLVDVAEQNPPAEPTILLGWGSDMPALAATLDRFPSLRWLHLRWAGVHPALIEAVRKHGTLLTNGSGAHGIPIAEYVLAGVLAHYKRLDDLRQAQREHVWATETWLTELRGKQVGIVGLGDLGLATARIFRAFGTHLRGLRRHGGAMPEVDEVFTTDRLDDFLVGLDILVLAAPLTAETRGLIGAAQIARLKLGAFLVNVGRGPVLDETALVDALRSGQLAGAAVDVFAQEPLPPDSPLWDAPNLRISPHCSDHTNGSTDRAVGIFSANLTRFKHGEPLENVVNVDLGY